MSRMVHQYVRQFGQRLVHRQGQDTIKESDGLKIHLSATELVFLGVGRNLGAGLYIVLGAVAKYVAGPAIVVCFLVAGLSSLLSRLCYVEFDARVLRSSSAYVCSYVMMGQLWPFVVGWNIILLFLIATACTAHAWRCAFDSLTGDRVSQALEGTFPLHVPYLLAMYADFFALGLVLLLAVLLTLGVPESAWVYRVFTVINFWFSASSSSLASLWETCTTGSSRNRTTHWPQLYSQIAWALQVLEGLCLLTLRGLSKEQLRVSMHLLVLLPLPLEVT
uniref:Amino acid permease/ SLC12A domain-containing protein n=1 Tax=Capra hircus TaxID=9925 RepID=A0A8C2RG22_CAPHI